MSARNPNPIVSAGARLAFLLLAGCALGAAEPAEPPIALPATYGGEGLTTDRPAEEAQIPWWESFEDPQLAELIERALASNTDLRTAYHRVQRAGALADQLGAARLPRVGFEGSASGSSSLNGFTGQRTENINLSASIPVSYELDLFARYANEHHAAATDAQAAGEDLHSLIISLSAQVAETFYDLVDLRGRRGILQRQLETGETFLELVMMRFR
ncbi:MAG: TolC family protein, partial [Myxococcales bacterium]|nr:TolC family protein [Myxococcales bacterium]